MNIEKGVSQRLLDNPFEFLKTKNRGMQCQLVVMEIQTDY